MPQDMIKTLKYNVSDNGVYAIEEQVYLMPNRRIDSIGWQYSGTTPTFFGTMSSVYNRRKYESI